MAHQVRQQLRELGIDSHSLSSSIEEEQKLVNILNVSFGFNAAAAAAAVAL